MSDLKVKVLVTGTARENTYVVANNTGACMLVDPGDDTDKIIAQLNRMAVKPAAILLTHCHFDHIISVNPLQEQYQIPVFGGADEKEMALNPAYNKSTEVLGYPIVLKVDHWLTEGDVDIASFALRVIHTPGHTRGCCCYYFYNDEVLFTGDTLFRGSVGRTDLPCSQPERLLGSIQEKLFCLPPSTVVYPGHGMKTTIALEQEKNPFFR